MARPVVVFYVSGHGLGHSARALGVVNAMPPWVDVVVRTPAPAWFWHGEATRPITLLPGAFDVGAVQLDNLRSDGAATLAAALALEARLDVDAERALWERLGVSAVVCDVAPTPLLWAREAGVPAFLVCNFTWVDIYRPYVAEVPDAGDRARYGALVDRLAAAYRAADLVMRTPMAMDLAELGDTPVEDVSLIVRPMTPRRADLRVWLGVGARARVGLVSTGVYGIDLDWGVLSRMTGWSFVSFNPPEGVAGVRRLDHPAWRSQDVTASVDAVVAKAGYGTLAECMAAGVPLVYPPRQGFAEHAALERAVAAWGGGVRVDEARFRRLDVEEALGAALGLGPLARPALDGAERVAARIVAGLPQP